MAVTGEPVKVHVVLVTEQPAEITPPFALQLVAKSGQRPAVPIQVQTPLVVVGGGGGGEFVLVPSGHPDAPTELALPPTTMDAEEQNVVQAAASHPTAPPQVKDESPALQTPGVAPRPRQIELNFVHQESSGILPPSSLMHVQVEPFAGKFEEAGQPLAVTVPTGAPARVAAAEQYVKHEAEVHPDTAHV